MKGNKLKPINAHSMKVESWTKSVVPTLLNGDVRKSAVCGALFGFTAAARRQNFL